MIQSFGNAERFTNWRGRLALELTNGVVHATLLPGGGHIAELRFCAGQGHSTGNFLWEAPWQTFDPGHAAAARFADEHDELGAGRFLASFTGHALCLDGFGSPSGDELALGGSLHGEAATTLWKFAQTGDTCALGSADLLRAGLRVERELSLLPGESVLRVDERVINLSDSNRPLHWVQHATIGAPVFSEKDARVTASVQRGMTWPFGYEGKNLLVQDREFTWPLAPRASGGDIDLRDLFVEQGTGFVAAAKQITAREQGFVAAADPKLGVAMGYLFPTDIFPWVTFWEENGARQDAPWCGNVQARGLEFGTTPLPIGNEAIDARGSVLGAPTSLPLEARQTQRAPWLLFAAEVPRTWREIDDIRAEADEIVLSCGQDQVRLSASGAASFLKASRASADREVLPC